MPEETERVPTAEEADAIIDKLQKPSNEEKDEVSEAEATPEPEEKEEPKYTETEITRRAQSLKDKEMKAVYKERDGYKSRIAELEAQIKAKEDSSDLDTLFNSEKEELGDEEKARQRDSARRKFNERYIEWKRNALTIESKSKEIEERAAKLDEVEKIQQAREILLPYVFPRDKKVVSLLEKYITELTEGAETREGMEKLAKALGTELQSKLTGDSKPFKPDSSKGSASGSGRLTLQQLKDYSVDGKKPQDLKKDMDAILDQYTKRR